MALPLITLAKSDIVGIVGREIGEDHPKFNSLSDKFTDYYMNQIKDLKQIYEVMVSAGWDRGYITIPIKVIKKIMREE